MIIKDLKASLPYLFEAQLTPFIWGHAGIGKTTVVREYAKENGWHFFPLYLGTQSDSGDILGLAEFTERQDGTKSTDFATPGWMRDAIDYCKANPDSGAIIFLDEFNRGRRDILQGMFSLALDKKFHTIQLPKNLHIVAAGNPPTDDYNVTDIDDSALMARFVHIKLEPSFTEFVDYGRSKNFEPTILSFLQDQPNLLEDHRTNFDLPVKVDRRSYERLNKLFTAGTPENLMTGLMYGIIGVERTVAYQQHIKNTERPLTGEQILAGTHTQIIDIWSTPGNIVASLLSTSCDNLLATFKSFDKTESKLAPDQVTNFMTFMEKIPKETAISLLHKLIADDRSKTFYSLQEENEDVQRRLTELTLSAKNTKITYDKLKGKKK